MRAEYYDPTIWDELKEKSTASYERTLLKKAEELGKRYLAGTATPEEKVLLDELSERNQGELTDIWVKKSDSYFVEKTRISTHRHTYGQEIKYKELGVPPEIVEFWLTCSDPKKFSRRTDNSISAYRVLAR